MSLCDSDHAEVCFEGRKCPVCELIENKDAEITERDERIEELRGVIDGLEAQISSI